MKITYRLCSHSLVIEFSTDWSIVSFLAPDSILEQLYGVKSLESGGWQQHRHTLSVTIDKCLNPELMARRIRQRIDEFSEL